MSRKHVWGLSTQAIVAPPVVVGVWMGSMPQRSSGTGFGAFPLHMRGSR